MTELNGVLGIDKPEGPTSHDVVARARRALGLRRIGHTGTLDPFASGLLLLCLGPSTRLSEYLTGLDKGYDARLKLGEATDTDDLQGEVISRSDAWRDLSEARVRAALEAQAGTILQLPPTYSAKKVAGERSYAVARRGGEVERTPVEVTIHAVALRAFDPPFADFSVECSSGTYIRAIARDVGEALGVGAHLTGLRRTRVGAHDLRNALPLEALDDPAAVAGALLRPEEAVAHLPRVRLDARAAARVAHGNAVQLEVSAPDGATVALLSPEGTLLAIAERRGDAVHPRKVLA